MSSSTATNAICLMRGREARMLPIKGAFTLLTSLSLRRKERRSNGVLLIENDAFETTITATTTLILWTFGRPVYQQEFSKHCTSSEQQKQPTYYSNLFEYDNVL